MHGATSLAHRMALSRSFSYFFLGYINAIARGYPLVASTGTAIKDSSKVYIVFAGGDDLFLLGPWEEVIDAAQRIHRDFRDYTGNSDHLTISAGITYFKPTFPIRRFAHLTSEAIEAAKEPKDALSLFGEVLHWDCSITGGERIERLAFATLYDFAKNLRRLVVEPPRADEAISHSFLMTLLTLKRTSLDQGRIDWKWKLPYLLAQAGVTKVANSEKAKLLSQLAVKDEWFRSLEVPLMWVLLKTRRS